MYSKHRLEFLSDGIFAIVMTLLVLELKVPQGAPSISESLLHARGEWFGFVLTFCLASVFWVLQHRVFDLIAEVRLSTVVPTFVTLAFVALLPFSTSLLGNHIKEPVAFTIYFLNQFGIAASLFAKLEIARSVGALHPAVDLLQLRIRLGSMCLVVLAALISTAFLPFNLYWVPPVIAGVLLRALRTLYARKSAKKK